MVIQHGTLEALSVGQRSSDSASTSTTEFEGSIEPGCAAVQAVTLVVLGDIGTEVEDRPTS